MSTRTCTPGESAALLLSQSCPTGEARRTTNTTSELGSRVRVLDVDEDVEEEYTIVGSQEANPMEGCISDDSPFGFALKGHKVGETVTVTAPVGELQFKIIAVENED